MNKETFERYKNHLLKKAAKIRSAKEGEYFSESDLLGNFRKIAEFRETSLPETIMTLGSKHLQSISEMVNHSSQDSHLIEDQPTIDEWDEKFVDSINYLLKLYAAIREERDA